MYPRLRQAATHGAFLLTNNTDNMDLTGTTSKQDATKPQIESQEQEKQEYKLIGQFLRTKGLKLFAYNHLKDELSEVNISDKDVVRLDERHLTPEALSTEEARVDTRDTHFEALNWKTAYKRLNKWKAGKVKELCNLRKPEPNGIGPDIGIAYRPKGQW